MDQDDFVEVKGIRISQNEIWAVQDGKVYRSVSLENNATLKVKFGNLSQMMVVQIVVGLLTICLGCFQALAFFNDVIYIHQILLTIMIPVGFAIIWDAFKKGYYLLVVSSSGKDAKLVFDKKSTKTDVDHFISETNNKLGIVLSYEN